MAKDRPVKILSCPGQLPVFWDRQAVFFANLLALFFGNEEKIQALADEVGAIDSYGGRLIPVLNLIFRGESSLLVLEREPDTHLCRYFREGLGLSLPDLMILEHSRYEDIGKALKDGGSLSSNEKVLERVKKHGAEWMDGYVTDETLSLIASEVDKKTVASRAGSEAGNNKYLLYQYLAGKGLPVVKTEIAASAEQLPFCLRNLAKAGFKQAVIKSQIGASGIGMMKVEVGAKVEVPEHYFFEGEVLVQGWMEVGELGVNRMRSPSVQLFLNEDEVCLYDITEQILSEASIHEGNESPPAYLSGEGGLEVELLRQAGLAGQWLHATGYRGTASVDFIVVHREGETSAQVYVCEINARVTGATYPSVLARHLRKGGAWLLRNLRLSEAQSGEVLLQCLDQAGHLFMPGMKEGVVPINFNFGEDGLVHKGQFLCLAETPEHCHKLLDLAEADLPMGMSLVRD
ncbi:MAG: ATP-grasp domain-containing protein [Verrucomicrobiales bacterium]|nr:ATP-grasp domain-containing protein [Verrucomicrobiales bacterium]